MKTLLLLLLSFSIHGNAVKDKQSRKLTEAQMIFIKENYNWKADGILIINFEQPPENCFYYNDKVHTNESINNWWKPFYKNLDTTRISNIFIYSNKECAKNIINGKTHFLDKEGFFLKNFFHENKNLCYDVMVINEEGYYEQKKGEYLLKDVKKLIAKLKKPS